MHKTLVLFVLLINGFLFQNEDAFGQSCKWAQGAGGTNYDCAQSVTTDGLGNVYAVGYFMSSAITFGTAVLTNDSVGTRDIFVVKYDSTGNTIWANRVGGTKDEYGNSIVVDTWGNVYVTGSFNSPTLVVGSFTLLNTGAFDIFLIKYDVSGNLIWAKNFGGTLSDVARSISVENSGNIFITGYFTSSSILFGTTSLTNSLSGNPDVYLVKFDSSGSVLWAKSAGGTGIDDANSVKADNHGNVYIGGYYYSTSFSIGSTTLTNAGNDDMFLAKYNSAGNFIWAIKVGDTGHEYTTSITIDANEKVMITGCYNSENLNLGSSVITNSSAGNYDIYTAQYDTSGNNIWVKGIGGTNMDYSTSISSDGLGNSYITGYFTSVTMNTGADILTNAAASADVFLVKYNSSGGAQWARRYGNSANDEANCVYAGINNDVYLAGFFYSPSIDFCTTTLTNTGTNANMFIAKFEENTVLVTNTENDNEGIKLFPNPVVNIANFVLPNPGVNNIKIYDCFGKEIFCKKVETNETKLEIDMSMFANGIYFLKVEGRDGVVFEVRR